MLDWIYKEDAEYVKQSAGEFSWDLVKSLSPLPDVIRPFMEDATNENFFFDRAIVPYEMEKVLPEFQYTEYTSETAKLIGKVIEDGFSLIPTKLYFKKGKAKVEIAIAKGKKLYDKRHVKKKRDWDREKARVLSKNK